MRGYLPAAGGLLAGTTDLAAGDGREGAVTGGAVGKEGGALHLLDVVEAGDADEALGVGLGARADLLEDLIGVGAAVHGELPHDPVAVVVVARGDGGVEAGPAVGVGVGLGGRLELNAGGPAVVEEVLDLAGDLLVGEGGEEGESLEEPEEKEGGRRSETVRQAHEGCGNEKKKLEDFLCGAQTPRIGVQREKLSDAGRRPPHAMRPTSIVASRDYGRAPKYRPRPNLESRVGERPSRSEGGASDRLLPWRSG